MRLGVFRTRDIVLIVVMLSTAGFTYTTKHEAENRMARIRQLEAEIAAEKDAIDVLRADWSLLTQPARLQRLTKVYREELALQTIGAEQIAGFESLPERRLEIEDIIAEIPEGAGEENAGRPDPTVTGGVEP